MSKTEFPKILELKEEINDYKSLFLGEYVTAFLDSSGKMLSGSDLLDAENRFIDGMKDKSKYKIYFNKLRAFVLLSHAAIEEFVEQYAKYLVKTSEDLYTQTAQVDKVLLSLLSESDKREKNSDIGNHITNIFNKKRQVINDNHGIKESNLEKIFNDMGYNVTDGSFLTCVPYLTQLGDLRGKFAHYKSHTSSQKGNKIQNLDNVNHIMKVFDDILSDFENKMGGISGLSDYRSRYCRFRRKKMGRRNK